MKHHKLQLERWRKKNLNLIALRHRYCQKFKKKTTWAKWWGRRKEPTAGKSRDGSGEFAEIESLNKEAVKTFLLRKLSSISIAGNDDDYLALSKFNKIVAEASNLENHVIVFGSVSRLNIFVNEFRRPAVTQVRAYLYLLYYLPYLNYSLTHSLTHNDLTLNFR